MRYDVAQRIKNGWAPSCYFDLPITHPRKTEKVSSDAEETDSSSQGSSDTEDETKAEQNTIQLDDTDNKITGYSESV